MRAGVAQEVERLGDTALILDTRGPDPASARR